MADDDDDIELDDEAEESQDGEEEVDEEELDEDALVVEPDEEEFEGDELVETDDELDDAVVEDEADALLAAPDPANWTGRRDRLLMLLMLPGGPRVSEITALPWGFQGTATVTSNGRPLAAVVNLRKPAP